MQGVKLDIPESVVRELAAKPFFTMTFGGDRVKS